MNFEIVEIKGDGNCLYRAILKAMGLNDNDYQLLKNAIANWYENNRKECNKLIPLDENGLDQQIERVKKDKEWGSELEILAFEQISDIKVIVYTELRKSDKSKAITHYNCTRGIEINKNDIKTTSPKITLIFANGNHYNAVIECTKSIDAYINNFQLKVTKIPENDNLITEDWIRKDDIPPGKNKEAPKEFLKKYIGNKYDSYLVSEKNGLEVWSFVRKNNNFKSFYTLWKKNRNIHLKDMDVCFESFMDKNTSHPSINDYLKDKSGRSRKKISETMINSFVRDLGKNIKIPKNLSCKEITDGMHKKYRVKIPHAICYTCSGRSNNKNKHALFKYYENFEALVQHCSDTHNGMMSAKCYLNLDIARDNWILILASTKPETYMMMRKDALNDIVYSDEIYEVEEEDEDDTINENEKTCPNKIRLGGYTPENNSPGKIPKFKIFGWNARKAFKPENVYFIEKFLTENSPDFLLINDSGKYKERICKAVPLYGAYHSSDSLICFYKKNISVTPIWKEDWDEVTMILKVTLKKQSLILINAYRRPDDFEATLKLTNTILSMDERYLNTPIITFGDFNYKRKQINKVFESLTIRNFKFIHSNNPHHYTRSQMCKDKLQVSYLDYFLIKNVSDFKFKIREAIGNSDHRCLEIDLLQDSMRIERRILKEFKFSQIKKNSDKIGKRLLEAMKKPDCLTECSSLVNELRKEFPKRKVFLKSHFKVIEKLNKVQDKEAIKSIIKNSNTESYCRFMSSFEKLRISKKWKEYYAKLRFYSDLNKDVAVLSNLSIILPSNEQTVTIDKELINKEVTNKYKTLFKDNGEKILYYPLNNEIVEYTQDIVSYALKKLDLNKATSWDMIPGNAFQIFNKKENLPHLVNFINEFMKADLVPENLSLGRLLCLNKNANEPGNINGIRPIAIMSVIIKICEIPLLRELKKVKLNINQIGFLQGMGCEVNILRFRQTVHDLRYLNYKRNKKMEKRYLLFVDLKCAFDSVSIPILIKKLIIKGVSISTVNGLIKLMNCSKISTDMENIISINAGVAQGKLCSPLLFNIYFDDLLDVLNIGYICHQAGAYADDLVVFCKDYHQLTNAITVLRNWCMMNEITINENKSGIMILNSDKKDSDEIYGFPVVDNYKYLGVVIDSTICAKSHIAERRKKLDSYFRKNFMLHKKYMTPFSFIRIIDFFVKSRLSYGLCCFLDSPGTMNMIDTTLSRHLKSIFGLPKGTSHELLRVVIGEPDIRVRLSLRLLKVWHKYKEHFGIYPLLFQKVLLKYFSIFDVFPVGKGLENLRSRYWTIKSDLISENLNKKAQKYMDLKIRNDHADYLKNYFFSFTDLRSFYVIRYFTRCTKGTHTRLFPTCHCGLPNKPSHGANDCREKLQDRDKIKIKIQGIFLRNDLGTRKTLYDYLLAIYFNIDKLKNKDRTALIEILKNTIVRLVREDKSRNILESIKEENSSMEIMEDN